MIYCLVSNAYTAFLQGVYALIELLAIANVYRNILGWLHCHTVSPFCLVALKSMQEFYNILQIFSTHPFQWRCSHTQCLIVSHSHAQWKQIGSKVYVAKRLFKRQGMCGVWQSYKVSVRNNENTFHRVLSVIKGLRLFTKDSSWAKIRKSVFYTI